MPIRNAASVFVSIIQEIHVLSMIASLLGAIPFSLVSFFNTIRLLVWKIEWNPPDWVWTPVFLFYFLLPAALVLYVLAKGLGRFVAKEHLSFIAEINRKTFNFVLHLRYLHGS